MSKFIGRLVNLGIAKESSRGAGASPTYNVPKMSFSFDDKITKARTVSSLGKIADSLQAVVTTRYGQGEVEGEIRSSSFGLFLYALFGSLATTGPSDSAYTHTFSMSHSNQHQSLSLVVDDPNTNELYKLAMLESLEIVAELDEMVRFTAGFMSKKGNDTSLTVPAAESEYKFSKKHVRIKVAANIAGLAAASPLSIKSMTLTFSKNTTLDDVLGTAEPEDILNRQFSVEGQLSLNYEDETWKNYFRDGTYRAMEIAFINSDEVIGAGTSPSLTFQFPKVDFFEWEPNYGLDDVVSQNLSFKANHDIANNADMVSSAILINSVSSY